jgi:hypothetical protein
MTQTSYACMNKIKIKKKRCMLSFLEMCSIDSK